MSPLPPSGEPSTVRSQNPLFPVTHWSAILLAGHPSSPDAPQALADLCQTYRYPLYAFLRRKGHSSDEADDLIQEFFAQRVVTGLIFRGVTPGEGKFRTWLLNSLQNFVRNQFDKHQAKKRGGGVVHHSIDLLAAEGRYGVEPVSEVTPETLYERAWAITLIEQTLDELRRQYVEAGKGPFFEEMKCYLPGALSSQPHSETAARLGKTRESVKQAALRLRQEYGKALLAEIKRTVSKPNEVQEELRYLLRVLGS